MNTNDREIPQRFATLEDKLLPCSDSCVIQLQETQKPGVKNVSYQAQIKKEQQLPMVKILSICFLLFNVLVTSSYLFAQTKGDIYFQEQKFNEAADYFYYEHKDTPDDPVLNYKLGRSLLAEDKPEQAIGYLEKAVQLAPENAGYYFWQGVGHWAMLNYEKEKQSYLKAIKLEPNHLFANLYLGHNYLDQNQFKKALKQYDLVLDSDPKFPEALYNRALVLEKLDRKNAAVAAWKSYLAHYVSGKWAIEAAEHLKLSANFSYRVSWLGGEKIVMPTDMFKRKSSRLKNLYKKNIEVAAKIMVKDPRLILQIVTYTEGKVDLAEARAKAIKRQILESNPAIIPSRVKVSWFDTAETILSAGKTYVLNESIHLFTQNEPKIIEK